MRTATRLLVLAAAAALWIAPLEASADHNGLEQLSAGPAGGNGAIAAAFAGASADGSRAFFETSERLVAADTDSRVDVYERSGGVTILVSAGEIGGNGGHNAFFAGTSSDGARVFIGSAERLAATDTDTQTDIYERSGGTTVQVSIGPGGGNGSFPASFDGSSADGSRVFFRTAEQLVVGDLDSQSDVYERSGTTTSRLSTGTAGGNGAFAAFFAGASQDGSRVFFESQEPLAVGDADTAFDIYESSGGATSLVSTGSAGGNGASDAFFDGNSASGARVFFTTDEVLEPSDGDAQYDVYQRAGGATTRMSTGASGGNGALDALYRGSSEDGSRVFFETPEALIPADTDTSVDVYERAGTVTSNISTGPAGGNGAFDASFAGTSADGSRVFLESEEILTVEDVDAQVDVYEGSGGMTTLQSVGPSGGNGAFDALYSGSSDNGTRVFFETEESLVSADSDARRDVYERTGAVSSRVSGGYSGGNGAFDASFAGSSENGTRIFVATNERLVIEDSDSSQDLYGVSVSSGAYPRPGGATPVRVPLVPVFAACTNPNSAHVPPFDSPSCTPAPLASSLLTTSAVGRGSAFVRLEALPGNPATPEDEADIRILLSSTDIRKASDGTDYPGQLVFTVTMRITDRANSSFETVSATVQDVRFDVPISCGTTADETVGATCNLNLTTDVLFPGFAKEGTRMVISTFDIQVLDAGPDGTIAPPAGTCPRTCGSGDETPFLTPGIFSP